MSIQKKEKKHSGKKRLCATVAVLLLSVSWSAEVKADVIWEPYEDDFYEEHYDECKHVSASYLTNGREGYVTAYKAPDSTKEVAQIMNGKSFTVSFSWEDKEGNDWGIIELNQFEPEKGESKKRGEEFGWVLMENMAKVYNGNDFMREHEAEFEEYSGELDDYTVQDKLIVWSYPGSGKMKSWLNGSSINEDMPQYEHLYTDADGNRWTYIGYHRGAHNGWICIDAPEAEVLYVSYETKQVTEELYEAKEPQKAILEAKKSEEDNSDLEVVEEDICEEQVPGLSLAAGLVAGVVAVTAGLIAVLFGKKKKE